MDEREAYALETWSRFDTEVSDRLLRAVCGAFVVIAAADGEIASEEVDDFVQLLRLRADAFPGVDLERAEQVFRDLGQALLSDPVAGRRRALECVAAVRDSPEERELVHGAAVIAVLADRDFARREARRLDEITRALGMKPEKAQKS